MQKRDVYCQFSNGTLVPDALCEASEKPITKQECYNDVCKGTWKVGDWTEVKIAKYQRNVVGTFFFNKNLPWCFCSVTHPAIRKESSTEYYNAFGTVQKNQPELPAEICLDQLLYELVEGLVVQKVSSIRCSNLNKDRSTSLYLDPYVINSFTNC